MTFEVTGTLKNCVRVNNDHGYYVWGNVYGDIKQRFPDGTRIHTSQVIRKDGDLIFTYNSVYQIESWKESESHYIEPYEDHGLT